MVRQLGSEKEQGKMEAEQERAQEREVLLAEKQELHAERAKQQVAHQGVPNCFGARTMDALLVAA